MDHFGIETWNKRVKLAHSDILTAFQSVTVGTKVIDRYGLSGRLLDAVEGHDFSKDEIPGQGFLLLPPETKQFVVAGVGKRTKNQDDYVCREWRGRVDSYLKREFAAPVEGVALVVHTRAAYLNDPQVRGTPEALRIEATEATHVLVAVLAFAGPKPPLPVYRLVANLAGGNNAALAWTAERIRQEASAAIAYDEWVAVAD